MPSGSLAGGGSPSNGNGYTDVHVYSDGHWVNQGRIMQNGQGPIVVTSLLYYASGRGATRQAQLFLLGSGTGVGNIGASGSAQSTGWWGCSIFVGNGASGRAQINFTGSSYFGRGGGGTVYDSYGPGWSGSISGQYSYVEGPTEPQSVSVTALPGGQARVTYAGPSSNGGSAIEDYVVQRATNSSFTSGVAEASDTNGDYTFTGLTPGVTYWFRVCARNGVTNSAGTRGPWSSTVSKQMLSGGRVWNGSSWVTATFKVWNGSSWANGSVRVWDGNSWEAAL